MKKLLTRIIPLFYGQWLNLVVLFDKQKAAQIAFDIFCTIRKGRVRPEQEDFLDAAKLSVEEVIEQQIQAYRWPGGKDTVLLLHGWESNTHRWRNLIKKLQEHDFDILAFDAPAHGNSTGKMLHVPLYAHTLRHFLKKYQPKSVVAHSIGGMTILYDHFVNPESSVEKIVTVGSPCEFERFMHHYQEILKFNKRVWKAMDKRLKDWFGYHFNEFSSARFVTNNTKKGLLFHDKSDMQVPYTESVRVHEHWKGSKLVLTEGLGHSMHQTQVNEQIVAFLEE
ncbi:alpha/beta fold hydrolase [Allomuricauda sp. SCSIO 65647]|uniref:alpha/beta fold hydrolase n=1 Tax=Allomuricauda sp. SCSIO 65647 TaxID=2908843 RepID=UPI001F32DF85|nr:alpha/beta hydrolase [Muricauda sp. SCSIO 65647]UJH66625.1 alpha/beta hydrolase [Muricauda sp. SCSIO 65647]